MSYDASDIVNAEALNELRQLIGPDSKYEMRLRSWPSPVFIQVVNLTTGVKRNFIGSIDEVRRSIESWKTSAS